MPVGRENIDIDFLVKDFVDQPMLFRDAARPLACTVTRQRFGLARACARMIHQFVEQLHCFLMGIRLVATKHCQVFFGSFRINDFVHSQSELSQAFIASRLEKRVHFPCLICSRPSSTRAKNSSRLISVGSCFLAVSFFRYLASCFISGSLSAISAISRQICAFSSNAVIASKFWFTAAKLRIIQKRTNIFYQQFNFLNL